MYMVIIQAQENAGSLDRDKVLKSWMIFTSEGHKKLVHNNSHFLILDLKIYTLSGAIKTNLFSTQS